MKAEKHGNKYRIQKMINGQRYNLSFDHKPTKKEIEQAVSKAYTETPSKAIRGTFKSYAEQYIDIKENVLSPSTVRSYHSMLRSMSEDFLNIKMNELTAADVQAEINRISLIRSAKTVANYNGFISPVVTMYRPDLNLNTTLPMGEQYVPYVPTDDEVKMILSAAKGKSYELALYLGVYGMRRSEVCAVTSDDLDGNNLTINKALVKNKKNELVTKHFAKTDESTRTIYIDNYVATLLNEQGKGYNGYPSNIWDNLTALQKRLGIPHFRYHDLRHYYASMAHSLGIPDSYIMRAGGWSSDHVLKRVYRHAQADKEKDMMAFASSYITEQLESQ